MIGWILSFLAIIGAVFNARKKRVGFLIWIVSNAGWICVNIQNDFYSQIPLWIVMTILSVYGYINWGK